MNVLILGSGGREHALSWKISKSSLCKNLFVAPGNAGTKNIAKNVKLDINNFKKIKHFVLKEEINMVIVGPEEPLVNGIYDYFKTDNELSKITLIGPSKEGAKLEGSKEYAKKFMNKYDIPTAKYHSFTKETFDSGVEFINNSSPPYVLKADGLAGGKGVVILNNKHDAKKELHSMLIDGKFGIASSKVVIEEFLEGAELSVFVITDGNTYKVLPTAKDYKKIGENDIGLNTGGMGAISPVPFADRFYMEKVEREIIKPTVLGLKNENIEYQGFIFFGLINVKGQPKVIEYNVRMGDPETEAVVPRIKSDLLNLLIGIKDGTFSEKDLYINDDVSISVVLASGGYPNDYETGKVISGLDKVKDGIIFHAGTKEIADKIVTNGGRVLAVTCLSQNINDAYKKVMNNIETICFNKKYYRKDIGLEFEN